MENAPGLAKLGLLMLFTSSLAVQTFTVVGQPMVDSALVSLVPFLPFRGSQRGGLIASSFLAGCKHMSRWLHFMCFWIRLLTLWRAHLRGGTVERVAKLQIHKTAPTTQNTPTRLLSSLLPLGLCLKLGLSKTWALPSLEVSS